ncbi:MAG: hypothetical protein ABI405_07890 [Parafilimonas sp.]
MNIILRHSMIILLLLICFSSYSQTQKVYSCADRIDQLYAKQKIHLIFCSYYFEKVNTISGADTILDNLSFYRDTLNAAVIQKKDSVIIANLKKKICNKDTGLITEIDEWCGVSKKVAEIRSEVSFTLEGYMVLLNSFKKTSSIFSPLLKPDEPGETIYSLSTDQMEWIYFTSISLIKSLKEDEQNIFFKKLENWNFK